MLERVGLSLDDLLPLPTEDRSPEDLYLALDTVQDPQNVGSIFRTAAFFGVAGLILTRDRSAPLSAVAYDVASGGLEHVPFSLQTNLS
ncbi:MAG: TrmH family RNA methyltransferase, partial [Candidatus Latescibacteria bacterium]|nr:TrmH family RNA methyltransferase [Candidatus Latescibacterota bacterium]